MPFIARILNWLRTRIRSKLFTFWVRFKLWLWGARIGRRLKSDGNLNIYNRGTILVGDDCHFSSGWMANPVGGAQCSTFQVLKGAKLSIGNSCGISNAVICCRKGITLEDGASLGGGTSLYDNDFHPLDASERIWDGGDVKSAPIIIRRRAWVGGHCLILKGVTIGENSVIGAGSVVTRDIPANVIAAGVPAKVLRRLPKRKNGSRSGVRGRQKF